MVFDAISSNIYDFPLINRYAVFVFGDFNIHHKDWLTYSGGTDGPGKLYYNFSLLNDLTLMLFLLGSLNVTLSPLFWIYLFLF